MKRTLAIALAILSACTPRQEADEVKDEVVIIVDGLAYSE